MPIGSSKLGVLGAGLVPGGTITFNTSGNWTVPPGVKKVSITGKGGSGNPGNSGTAGNPGNAGGGGGGGGGAFAAIYAACAPVTCPTQDDLRTAGGGGSSPGGGNGGAAGVNPNPAVPNTPAPTSVAGSSGNTGSSGNSGSGGSAGNPGNTGASSSGLGQNFTGGSGGNAGNAGAAGNGGTGGNGGGGGGTNSANINSPVATPGSGGNGGGSGVNSNSYVPTTGPGNTFIIGQSYNVCTYVPAPTDAPGTVLFSVPRANYFGYPGGGGAGETNNGYTLNFAPGPTFNHLTQVNLINRTPTPPNSLTPLPCNPLQDPQYIAPFNCPVVAPRRNGSTWDGVRRRLKAHIISNGGNPGGGRGGFGKTFIKYNPPPVIPPFLGGGCSGFGPPNVCPTIYYSGLAASNSRAGGGGGGAGAGGGGLSAGAGGGGGRGNAGNAGGAGGAGGTGAAATPSTVNCVNVTPGATVPITVGSPGGQIVISWNPQ